MREITEDLILLLRVTLLTLVFISRFFLSENADFYEIVINFLALNSSIFFRQEL